MRWCNRQSLIACGGLVLVVGAAYVAGRARFEVLISLGSLTAVALAVAAMIQPRPAERVAGAALLGWVILATATEQFAWTASQYGVVVAAVWLIPPIVGGAVLPAAGHWRSGAACWAAAFAGVAASTYSVHSVYSGAGLFIVWRY